MSRRRKRTVTNDDDDDNDDIVEEQYDEEEDSSFSSSSVNEEDEYSTFEYTWTERNEYVQSQLDFMSKLSNISDDFKEDDEYFALKLKAKIQNMYNQLEPLLEAEGPTQMTKAYISLDDNGRKTTITKELKRLGVQSADLKSIGVKSSRKFKSIYGRPPKKATRYIDGVPRLVNEYTEDQAEQTVIPVIQKLQK